MKRFQVIYLITNLVNGKIYIGKHVTDDLNDDYFGSGVVLKQAIKKYGRDNFRKVYLHIGTTLTTKELNEFEIYYIQLYNSNNPKIGYNLTEGGDGGATSGTWVKGHKDSDETRRKKSESHKGKTYVMTEEHKQKISAANKGRKMTDEQKQKIAAANKGRPKSAEECKRISESNKGKPKSEEHRKKLSDSLKGKLVGDKNPNFGKHHTFGPMSEEHKQKIRESNIKTKNNKLK